MTNIDLTSARAFVDPSVLFPWPQVISGTGSALHAHLGSIIETPVGSGHIQAVGTSQLLYPPDLLAIPSPWPIKAAKAQCTVWDDDAFIRMNATYPRLVRLGKCENAVEQPSFGQHLLMALGSRFDLVQGQPIAEFLEQYPFLVTLLIDGADLIRRLFGAAHFPVLQLLEEPDAPGYTELFAIVRTHLAVEDASAKLEEFDTQWWLEASLKAKGRLNFAVEYL